MAEFEYHLNLLDSCDQAAQVNLVDLFIAHNYMIFLSKKLPLTTILGPANDHEA